MSKNLRLLVMVLVGVALAFGVFVVLRARSNLVTLNVRNASLRKVIKKIEWQTWEDIYVNPDVHGNVTLNVRKVPLEEVLRIIGEQTASRSAAVYPLYSSRATLNQLRATVQAGKTAGDTPWKSWQQQTPFLFAKMLGNALRDQNQLVNVQFVGKDAAFAAQSLNRVSSARIVLEDNTPGLVSLQLSRAAMPDAVAQLARQVQRSWTVFYVLSAASFMGRPGSPVVNPMTSLTPEQKAERDKQFEASLATLTPEEQAKARQRRTQMEAVRDLPPQQRAQAMQQNPDMLPQMQERFKERFIGSLKDSTPDQRVERSRMLNERLKEFK